MKTLTKIVLLLLIFSFSCKEEKTVENQNASERQILTSEVEGLVNDPFTLMSAQILNSSLQIEVQYAGGCAEHEFTLVYPEIITLQYPPNFSVELYHNGIGDTCEALITETITFDLKRNPMNMSLEDLQVATLWVVNGSNTDESVLVD